MPRYVLPFVCHLFHRPRPVPEVQGDRVIWRCACGCSWVEPLPEEK